MATFRGPCQHCGEITSLSQYSIDPKCHVCTGDLREKPKRSKGVSVNLKKDEKEEVVVLPSGKENKKLAS